MTSLRQRLGHDLVVGVEIASGSASAVELVGGLDFHFGLIDTRHAAVSAYSLEHQHLVRAADAAGLTVVTRIVENSPGTINRVLNDGSSGVVVACDTAAQALQAAHSMRYPPAGFRGAAPVVRAARLGLTAWEEYRTETNAAKPLLVLVESTAALDAAAEIAATEGVDAVVFDLLSLSQALGVAVRAPGDHERVDRAVAAIATAGRCVGVALTGSSPPAPWVRAGATLVVLGSDLETYASTTRAMRMTLDGVPTRLGGRS